ncbi:response regulator transcription factor (plasmid) [Arthrobacter sp. G.S.26]|uniref:helix-turn-helix transcriptional regulator n=1 Tax=Arthrobacter sp. G.S.26 TaxID=3433706 RepID=UPI003D789FE2
MDLTLGWSGSSVESIARRLEEDHSLHLAVVTESAEIAWRLATSLPCSVAGVRDLFLELDELQDLCRSDARPVGNESALELYQLTGGWLRLLEAMLGSGGLVSAKAIVNPALSRWLDGLDSSTQWDVAGFLPSLETEFLSAFEYELQGGRLPLVDELAAAGLARHLEPNGWFIPSLVRNSLVERMQNLEPGRAENLAASAVRAMDLTAGVPAAVSLAVRQRSWPALKDLLAERWADLFISDPSGLARSVGRLPRFLSEQSGLFPVAMRILTAAGAERMELPLPSLEPDYARDTTAQRLRKQTDRLYRNPGAKALTVGLLKISYLRLSGNYVEAAEAASRLRLALSKAADVHQINPVLGCFVELHAGITFHLAGQSVPARQSYEAALDWAHLAERAFLDANITSNLALLSAQEGDTDSARDWIARHEAVEAKVGWGRRMVGRCADLARAHIAISSLDVEALRDALLRLPRRPDNDEFWSVHTWCLGMRNILQHDPDSAIALMTAMRHERPYASAAPLATRMLAHVELTARTCKADVTGVSGSGEWPELRNLEVLGHLISEDQDKALKALDSFQWTAPGPRHRNPALYLEMAARASGDLDPLAVAAIERSHRRDGEPIDLLPLRYLGLSSPLEHLLEPGARAMLRSMPVIRDVRKERPVLTAREQEILDMLRQGLTRKQIADTSYRSENTIKTQLKALYRKLGVETYAQAIEQARQFRL